MGERQNDRSDYVCRRVTEQHPGLRGVHGNFAIEPTGSGVLLLLLLIWGESWGFQVYLQMPLQHQLSYQSVK